MLWLPKQIAFDRLIVKFKKRSYPGLESAFEGLDLTVELLKGVFPGGHTLDCVQSCWYFCGEGVTVYKNSFFFVLIKTKKMIVVLLRNAKKI